MHRATLTPYGARLTGKRSGQVVAVKVRDLRNWHAYCTNFSLARCLQTAFLYALPSPATTGFPLSPFYIILPKYPTSRIRSDIPVSATSCTATLFSCSAQPVSAACCQACQSSGWTRAFGSLGGPSRSRYRESIYAASIFKEPYLAVMPCA